MAFGQAHDVATLRFAAFKHHNLRVSRTVLLATGELLGAGACCLSAALSSVTAAARESHSLSQ